MQVSCHGNTFHTCAHVSLHTYTYSCTENMCVQQRILMYHQTHTICVVTHFDSAKAHGKPIIRICTIKDYVNNNKTHAWQNAKYYIHQYTQKYTNSHASTQIQAMSGPILSLEMAITTTRPELESTHQIPRWACTKLYIYICVCVCVCVCVCIYICIASTSVYVCMYCMCCNLGLWAYEATTPAIDFCVCMYVLYVL